MTGKGVNVMWFDSGGNLRGRLSGASAVATRDSVVTAGATFAARPTALVAGIVVAWATAGELRISKVGCLKK